ncbi:MAG: hypothetical protein M5U12_06295 [Verrucomicrobia bacterium]|nr:hypothetical protein [Verrucomicrobiota bacterium]
MPHLLSGLDYWVGEPRRVVIAGGESREEIDALVRAAHQTYAPNQVVMGTTGSVEPFAAGLPATEGRATAYVCTGNTCLPPAQDAEALARVLAEPLQPDCRRRREEAACAGGIGTSPRHVGAYRACEQSGPD